MTIALFALFALSPFQFLVNFVVLATLWDLFLHVLFLAILEKIHRRQDVEEDIHQPSTAAISDLSIGADVSWGLVSRSAQLPH